MDFNISLPFVLGICQCTTLLPQTRWLKAAHIYFLPISAGQESRHDLTGSSTSGSPTAAIKVSAGTEVSSEAQRGQDPLLNSRGCWQHLVLCCLPARGHPQLLATRVFPVWPLASSTQGKESLLTKLVLQPHLT